MTKPHLTTRDENSSSSDRAPVLQPGLREESTRPPFHITLRNIESLLIALWKGREVTLGDRALARTLWEAVVDEQDRLKAPTDVSPDDYADLVHRFDKLMRDASNARKRQKYDSEESFRNGANEIAKRIIARFRKAKPLAAPDPRGEPRT